MPGGIVVGLVVGFSEASVHSVNGTKDLLVTAIPIESPRPMVDYVLFDLDGTLIASEQLHHAAYNEALASFGRPALTAEEYCAMQHATEPVEPPSVRGLPGLRDAKARAYAAALRRSPPPLAPGAGELLRSLTAAGIETCIVTHSSSASLATLKAAHPELRAVERFVTRDVCKASKPSPEGFVRALALDPAARAAVAVEDTPRGIAAARAAGLPCIAVESCPAGCVAACAADHSVKTVKSLADLRLELLDRFAVGKAPAIKMLVERSARLYTSALREVLQPEQGGSALRWLVPLVASCRGHTYLLGIGKCGLVAAKSVSTWTSMGLRAQTASVPNLFHGDFGGIAPDDLLVYVSNSGTTEELVKCASYVRDAGFGNLQVAITLQPGGPLASACDFSACMSEKGFVEIDNINMAPTVSSAALMAFLDVLGVAVAQAKGVSSSTFQRRHPAGLLGKSSSRAVDAVVLVASGAATRLYPMTKDVPKPLVPLDGRPLLDHILDAYGTVTERAIIIVRPAHADLTQFYADAYLAARKNDASAGGIRSIEIRTYDRIDGTAATVAHTLGRKDWGSNLLIAWGDIVPEAPSADALRTCLGQRHTTVFVHGDQCRYLARDGRLDKLPDGRGGNVVGLYLVHGFRGLRHWTDGEDVADVFVDNFGAFETVALPGLLDVGDAAKYAAAIKAAGAARGGADDMVSRPFNRVERVGDSGVRKTALTDPARALQARELAWYDAVKELDIRAPRILHVDDAAASFTMEAIDGIPVAVWLDGDPCARRTADLVRRVLGLLAPLHAVPAPSQPTPEQAARDLRIEALDKVISRCASVETIWRHFGIRSVNGVPLPFGGDVAAVAAACHSVLAWRSGSRDAGYTLIHGDVNFSNVLVSQDGRNLALIDPRGYFGETSIYGPPEYDQAKVLYALSGYDALNSAVQYGLPVSAAGDATIKDGLADWPSEALACFSVRHHAWLAIIWLSLTSYIAHDANKVAAAYAHGMYYAARVVARQEAGLASFAGVARL
ncbi:hypothetical protein DFJ74DRAFT_499480 [Hyaloraphidium curvatum]|nr:hypothetical protein DFJ74DRAFT_499480 [Hyaloraphidium curvatum]